MAHSSSRKLPQAGEEITLGDLNNVNIETRQSLTNDALAHMPFSKIEDPQTRVLYQDSHSSESTPPSNIPIHEGHLAHELDTLQHDSSLSDRSDSPTPSIPQDQTIHINVDSGFQQQGLDESAGRQHSRWTMFYFRPLFLVPFSFLLLFIIVNLEVLYQISQRRQGLTTASESMHYAWTYGPTLALTMIATLWSQLEQCAKQIMPWSVMSCGETTAERSLMLNYITSSMLGSLFRSLKRRHFLVSLGISGSLIIRLSIIFSTGLLRLEYRSVTFIGGLRFQDTFDLTKNVTYKNRQYNALSPPSSSAGYWYINKYGLPYPSGATPQFAVQSFVAHDNGYYDELSGEIQVFESALEHCDQFKFTYETQATFDNQSKTTASLIIPHTVREMLRPWCYNHPYFHSKSSGPVSQLMLMDFLNSTQVIYKCTDSTLIEDQDHRILFVSELWSSSKVSGFLCEPKYSLTRRAVTNITHDAGVYNNINISGAITETLEMGIQPFEITQKIFSGIKGVENLDNSEWMEWLTLLDASQRQRAYPSFDNTSLAIELSKCLWPGLAAYIVKHDYTHSSNQTFNGTMTTTQGRLLVEELPLRLIEALLALLLVFSMVLCFLRPGVFHRDPTSLGAHVMILARSPGLVALLEGHGAASKHSMHDRISACQPSYSQFHLPEIPAIALCQFQHDQMKPDEGATADNGGTREWWRPIFVKIWFRICVLTSTLGFMITLEVLLQVSRRGDGLGNVSLDGYFKYIWTLIPTFVLALLGLLFSAVDSTARTLYPFQLLRKGRASLEDILYDPARQVSLVAIIRAAWKRQFGLLCAIFPGILAPILTIITSGLYTVNPVPWTYDTELQLKDRFRPENRTVVELWNMPHEDDGGLEAQDIFTLTQFSNMSSPQWTQGGYALSKFGADNLRGHDGNDTSLYVTARVPATHANLNCSLIGQYTGDDYLIINGTYGKFVQYKWLSIDPQPLGCVTPPEWNQTAGQRNLYLSSDQAYNEDGTNNTAQGYYLSLLKDDYWNLIVQRVHDWQPFDSSIRTCGDNRQHYFFGLGHGRESMTVLHCVPYVETLWVTATFSLPHLLLVTDVPITPETNSSVFLSDSASMTAFPVIGWMGVVPALINGSSGVGKLAGLMPGPDDRDASRLIAAVEDVLAKYLAQTLHLYYRQPLDENYRNSTLTSDRDPFTPDGQPATGTVTDGTRLRLIQNEVSTRVLQGLLGVMAVCLVADSVLIRSGRIIPRDPGSIASRMAYFAGGHLWRKVPVGADRWTDEEIIKWGRENCQGGLLLDWWEDDGQEASEDGGPQTAGRTRKFAVDCVSRKSVA